MEMKELNESQRASHAESQMKLIQEQLRQLESRNEELEAKFGEVTKANLELQVAERELRDQIVTSVSRDEVQKMEKKIEVRIFDFQCHSLLCISRCTRIKVYMGHTIWEIIKILGKSVDPFFCMSS